VSVVVVGLSHRTAPLELLERMAMRDERLPKALGDLVARDFLSEAVVLSTCHRVEVYAVAERFHGAMADVRHFLSELSFVPPEDFADHLYVHYDDAAAAHLFSVTAGLDSVVVGETQILGQVRDAWERARQEEAAGSRLSLLFRQALEVGKRARTRRPSPGGSPRCPRLRWRWRRSGSSRWPTATWSCSVPARWGPAWSTKWPTPTYRAAG